MEETRGCATPMIVAHKRNRHTLLKRLIESIATNTYTNLDGVKNFIVFFFFFFFFFILFLIFVLFFILFKMIIDYIKYLNNALHCYQIHTVRAIYHQIPCTKVGSSNPSSCVDIQVLTVIPNQLPKSPMLYVKLQEKVYFVESDPNQVLGL
ncbi:hypothetical protein DFA_04666 [Cavenderia fasciculata]|uniref:Uncharacterized protein n=1 Tax=Cavenderia fasciculata TaxID=261658 RepID=F4PQ74_CACFS|nr:uncharacterized protein DFA_04666 [Cavenderia fasciculata]EGG22537.1 hypothetical protein DFA_04666 [Cavenderia fasciculata]|eukprot:XP_004360388.1 hypothetical protein DFA_04666 [Cavenderia fasciculata]